MLPDYIQQVLDGPAPGPGARHEALLDLSLQMVGEKVPDEEIFRLLRAWLPDKDKSDKEIRDLIRGAHAKNPKPTESKRYQAAYDLDRKTVKLTAAALQQTPTPEGVPTSALTTVEWLNTLFRAGEIICITNDYTESGDKLIPADKGTFWTREQWCEWLTSKKLDCLAGAWVRINPIKPGDKSGTDTSIADFRYVLVEFDSRPKLEQWHIFKESGLPIASVTDSGDQSLHALVRVDAKDYAQYKERQKAVYDRLADFIDDGSNINPSRFSRLPGILRGQKGNIQRLVAVNIGYTDWAEFEYFTADDGLPPIISLKDLLAKDLPEPPQIIRGVLAKGRKLVIGGPSKAKKSWVMINLAYAVANGKQWFGFECDQGKVLYLNFELHERTIQQRFVVVGKAMGVGDENIDAWNLRGKSADISKLVDRFIARVNRSKTKYSLIIVDPVYKCLGNRDENKAGDMTDFLNHLERLSEETYAAIAIAAHFPKGNHMLKDAMDRIAGSGVFIRDPDAIIAMTPCDKDHDAHNPTRFEIDLGVREFPFVDGFRTEWVFPLMLRLDKLTREEKRDYRAHQLIQIVELLIDRPLSAKQWEAASGDAELARGGTFRTAKAQAVKLKLVEKDDSTGAFYPDMENLEQFKRENTYVITPKKDS